MTQLSLSGVGVQYGATTVLRDVTVTIGAGDRWGVVGRNGSGKTSLFRIVMGSQVPTAGQVARVPGLRIAVLDQHRDFGEATTVWGAVADAFRELIDLEVDLARQADAMARPGHHATESELKRYASDLERFEHLGGYRYASLVDEVLEGLGFGAAKSRQQLVVHLSGGERGRVALARQLVLPADMLLLDEPTNHLDLETTTWLEEYLRNSRETQLIISHDRAFLERVVNHVLHLENESAYSYDGTYADFVRQRAERRLSQQRAFSKQAKAIAREEDYVRRNIAGQNTKQAKGRRKRLEWLPRLSPPPDDDATMAVRFEANARGGDQVAVWDKARVAIGDRVLLNAFTGWVRRGDVVGLIGPNGTGKSTLLKALIGKRPLESGECRIGGGVTAAVYTQDFSDVPRDKSIYDIIADLRPMWERGQVMGHLGRVQFSGDEVKRLASSLSGGELARVALAMMMLGGDNLLIFDEPTNHLDVESIEALEDAIELFEGTVLLVSHDRELLRKLVTRVWELREGVIREFDGEFAEWEERERERAELARQRQQEDAEQARLREKAAAKSSRGTAQPTRGTQLRDAKRTVERLEKRIEELEGQTSELTARLSDPALYDRPSGRSEAEELSRALKSAKAELETAISEWEAATMALEELGTA